jgi:hypothetical protein
LYRELPMTALVEVVPSLENVRMADDLDVDPLTSD